ncbi:MAG: oligosaccharide flippase family protein [Flavisolibacter sp.]
MLRAAVIRIVYMSIMFLAGLVLSNLALPEHFGAISLLVLNASLLSIVTGMGTDSMVLHKVSNGKWQESKALQFSWWALLGQLLVFILLEVLVLFFWKRTLLSNEGSSLLWADALYFGGLVLTEKYLALLYAFQKAGRANGTLGIMGLLYLVGLLAFHLAGMRDFQLLVFWFALQSFLQGLALAAVFHFRNRWGGWEKLEAKEFLSALSLSSVVMVTNLIQLLAYRLDFWILKYYYGNYAVGIYAQANKFANLTWVLPNILSTLLITRFALADKKDVPFIFSTAFYANLVAVGGTLVCAWVFYFYYLDPAYREGLPAFCLMLPGYFFWGTVVYISAYFSWTGKFGYNLLCSTICFLTILLADLVLIPGYGMKGAAWANTIAYSLVFFVYISILIRKFSFRWNEVFGWRKKQFFRILKLVNG